MPAPGQRDLLGHRLLQLPVRDEWPLRCHTAASLFSRPLFYRYLIAGINQVRLPNSQDGTGDHTRDNWHYGNCRCAGHGGTFWGGAREPRPSPRFTVYRSCAHGATAIAFTVSAQAGDVLSVAAVPAHNTLGVHTRASTLRVAWRPSSL